MDRSIQRKCTKNSVVQCIGAVLAMLLLHRGTRQILLTHLHIRWDIKLLKRKFDPLQVLWILNPVDKVPTVDFGQIGKWVVWRVDGTIGPPLTQDPLVTLCPTYVLPRILRYKI
jgi:hypothetical protein